MTGPIDELKRRRLINALKRAGGNRTEAAKELKLSVRTIRNWIRRFELADQFPPIHGRQRTQIG